MLRFYGLRILKDYLGHLILIGLPLVLISIMVSVNRGIEGAPSVEESALYIGIVYIIMFQGFGSAYTFEGIEHDFYKPFKNRLRATPVNPMKFVMANIFFSVVISFLQSIVLLAYVVIVFNAVIPNWAFVIVVLLMGVLFAQLLAALCIFAFKKASKAQAFITLYIIGAMVVAGFFFPLPESNITIFLSKYSTPLAWTHYAAYGFINTEYTQALVGVGLLGLAILIVAGVVYRLSKRVVL
ncbi:MAG: ABC transporter permease [Candidatus Izemoplasmataceae bacterium]|jgi:ABC-2 type transport system permease protein|uniref:ABC transporter permease n=1 Tax=Liberiplasma polymorphum TaxID=3374570 RepID=UPI0037714A72